MFYSFVLLFTEKKSNITNITNTVLCFLLPLFYFLDSFPDFLNKLNFVDENFRDIWCGQNFADGKFCDILRGSYIVRKTNIREI